GMTAYCALAIDDHAAREDVRAFDRDHDRHALIAAGEIVARPEHDALATMDIHRVVGYLSSDLGEVILHDRRRNRRLFAEIDGAGSHDARRFHDVSATGEPAQHFFHAFETADRHAELTPQPRIGTGHGDSSLGAACRVRGQRDAAPD